MTHETTQEQWHTTKVRFQVCSPDCSWDELGVVDMQRAWFKEKPGTEPLKLRKSVIWASHTLSGFIVLTCATG